MIDCPNGELRDLLPDLLHGRLDEADRQRVEGHLAGCADCRAELELLRGVERALRRAPVVDVAAIAAAIPPYRAPARRSWGGWRAAAAVALIAVGGTSVAIANRVGDEPVPAPAATVAQAPRGDAPVVATAPAPVSVPASRAHASAPASRSATSAAPRELAVAGAVGDLSDHELAALLTDIESLDVLPPAEVEATLPVTPAAPAARARGTS